MRGQVRRSCLAVTVLALLTLVACSQWGGQSQAVAPPVPAAGTTGVAPIAAPPGSATGTAPAAPAPAPIPAATGLPGPMYYDFPDVAVPRELEFIQDDSYIFQGGAMKAGLLKFKGRVDLASLINFFQAMMPRDGWKSRGGFQYRNSILIFEKPDKTCVINIYEQMFYTHVEVYMAPMQGKV